MTDLPLGLIVFAAVTAGALFGSALVTLFGMRYRRRLRAVLGTMVMLPALLALALAGLLILNVWGYRALTGEELAAVVYTEPFAPQAFTAVVEFPDGRVESYTLHGDELYIDARILKWKYWANLLGLTTAFELDRIAGRYRALNHERTRPRTVHSLAGEHPLDLFELRQRFNELSPLVDAEYGSATFIPADRAAAYEIRVSTTGLLARRIEAPAPVR